MPRYIDAEMVECKIDEMQNRLLTNDDLLWDINKPYYAGLAMARGFLNDTSTADVQEAKHGKWAIRYEGTYKRAKCYCSVCEKSNGIGGIISNQKKPYCPNCGAKMDLEENENEH